MAVSSPALAEAFAEVVGRDRVSSEPARLEAAAVDGAVPRWLVQPGSAGEAGRVLALAAAEGLAVAARGSGSAVGLGNPPRRLDLVLDTTALGGVRDYVPDDMVATVGAGITLSQLAAHLAPHGQRLALDPIGGESRTLGGVLATGASGPLRARYGTGRDLLLGVRFVQADGVVTWGGSRVVKSVTGYDVPKLLVGSLGTIGVIVEATLRLHPVPPASGAWRCSFAPGEAAQGFLGAILASPVEPERLTLVNESARRRAGWTGSGVAVMVGIGSVEEAVASQGAAVEAMARREGAEVERLGASGRSWVGLARALEAPVALRVAGPVSRAAAWLGRVEALAASAGADAAIVGQAANGALQVALGGTEGEPLGADGLERVLRPLRDELAGEGGSAVVERAPAAAKRRLDPWGPVDPGALTVMERLKREFDPRGALNPGRFVGGL